MANLMTLESNMLLRKLSIIWEILSSGLILFFKAILGLFCFLFLIYLALFYLRRLPGVLINESHNPNFKEGKINYKNYFNSNEYKEIMSHVKLGDLDLKLWIGFLIYKFHFDEWMRKK